MVIVYWSYSLIPRKCSSDRKQARTIWSSDWMLGKGFSSLWNLQTRLEKLSIYMYFFQSKNAGDRSKTCHPYHTGKVCFISMILRFKHGDKNGKIRSTIQVRGTDPLTDWTSDVFTS